MNARRVAMTLAVATAISAGQLDAHPLHTTLTELTEDRTHGTVRAVIRVFADDFGTAVSKSQGATSDAAAIAYIAKVFAMSDRAGRPLSLTSCGTKRTSDLLWICVEGASADGLAPLKVRSAVLCDLFKDQINVVQGIVNGARRSLLFTRGDGAKSLT